MPTKEYYKKNKEKIKVYNRNWNRQNKTKCVEYCKKYYQNNKEKINIHRNKLEIREQIRKTQKEYYYKNRDKILIRKTKLNKKYREENPEKYSANNKALKINLPKGTICCRCEEKNAVDRHHEDYNKPYEVCFCCRACHKQFDIERRARELDKNDI